MNIYFLWYHIMEGKMNGDLEKKIKDNYVVNSLEFNAKDNVEYFIELLIAAKRESGMSWKEFIIDFSKMVLKNMLNEIINVMKNKNIPIVSEKELGEMAFLLYNELGELYFDSVSDASEDLNYLINQRDYLPAPIIVVNNKLAGFVLHNDYSVGGFLARHIAYLVTDKSLRKEDRSKLVKLVEKDSIDDGNKFIFLEADPSDPLLDFWSNMGYKLAENIHIPAREGYTNILIKPLGTDLSEIDPNILLRMYKVIVSIYDQNWVRNNKELKEEMNKLSREAKDYKYSKKGIKLI